MGSVVGVLVIAGFGFRRGEGGEGFGKWDAWEGAGGEYVAFEWMRGRWRGVYDEGSLGDCALERRIVSTLLSYESLG